MNIADTIGHIEESARQLGLSVNDLCREAGVAASNFSRWKNKKTTPNLSTVHKLEEAIERHKFPPREREAKHRRPKAP